EDDKWVRYINRWHLEKADPRLKVSPPKKPIVFYVEHTVPVRYRRYVREGALWWNKAFEKVGITDAVEVYFQDKSTGAHMDKDPEDVRYNFLRWVTNDIATAIGPSRAHPLTGQILDADVVLTDGWIRAFWREANEIIPDLAMRGSSPELIAWLDENPQWDPRVRLAPPERRDEVLAQRRRESRGVLRFGGVAAGAAEISGSLFRSQMRATAASPWNCMAAQGKAIEMAVSRMHMELAGLLEEAAQPEGDEPKDKDGKKDEPKKEKPDLLDGIPEWFVGQALADLTAHEVGHTLGLRHNFKASSVYDLAEINSAGFKDKKPMTASVMDYNPVNINLDKSRVQGDYNMASIGAYDMWAIEYGYGFGDTKKTLERVADPELAFGSDEDVGGIDPTVRQYDFAKDPRDYAVQRVELAKLARSRILDKFVKSGESWSKARRGYLLSLNMQGDAVSIMANWVGTARVFRDRKGDPNGRPPIEVIPAAQQRAALKFVIDNAFRDEAFGLTPELLKHFTLDRFDDPGAGRGEPAWPVHDQIAGLQASALTMLINPVKLRRVYDNEYRVPADQEALTLPEMLDSVIDAIWTELDGSKGGSARKPAISSLRRNLQAESLQRLIDLSVGASMPGEAGKAIRTLAAAKLRQLKSRIEPWLKSGTDPYTAAHLADAARRIDKALDAQYIIGGGGGGMGMFGGLFLRPEGPAAEPTPEPEFGR
ncbi:MAG: zinc-dependent metalloprotease, partial [Phycisphaerae bacterium]|nr:zinc-dependent metalloprotease [Phycisphaerae bacterium]